MYIVLILTFYNNLMKSGLVKTYYHFFKIKNHLNNLNKNIVILNKSINYLSSCDKVILANNLKTLKENINESLIKISSK